METTITESQSVALTSEPLDAVERLEKILLPCEQVECQLVHRFAPGVYLREIFMPVPEGEKFLFVIGHKHKTKHFNIVLSGRVKVAQVDEIGQIVEGSVHEILGPCTFVSEAGVRKVLCVIEDTIWQTVHVTEETDLIVLRKQLIEESTSFQQHAIEKLRASICEN